MSLAASIAVQAGLVRVRHVEQPQDFRLQLVVQELALLELLLGRVGPPIRIPSKSLRSMFRKMSLAARADPLVELGDRNQP